MLNHSPCHVQIRKSRQQRRNRRAGAPDRTLAISRQHQENRGHQNHGDNLHLHRQTQQHTW